LQTPAFDQKNPQMAYLLNMVVRARHLFQARGICIQLTRRPGKGKSASKKSKRRTPF